MSVACDVALLFSTYTDIQTQVVQHIFAARRDHYGRQSTFRSIGSH